MIKLTNGSDHENCDHKTNQILSQIATEGLRLSISPGISPHMAKLIKICMNEVMMMMTLMMTKMILKENVPKNL